MSSRALIRALILILSVGLAGCRQADGPLPVAGEEVPNRLSDISRDLSAIARGDAQAPQDLADDLRVFVGDETEEARAAVADLARRTSEVIRATTVSEQDTQRLAHHLWTIVAAQELSERQVETLQNDIHALLMSTGVPEESALAVATQAGEVQQMVTDRERRWYEFF